jgi:hypothetical protein
MSHKTQGLRAFGLTLLVGLGLIASIPAASSAAGEWKIEGKTLTSLEVSKELLGAYAGEEFAITTMHLTLSCKELTPENESTFILTSGEGQATFFLEKCEIKPNHGCQIIEPVEFSFRMKLILHAGKTYVLIFPRTAKTSIIVAKFKKEVICLYGETLPYVGSVVAEFGKEEQVELAQQPMTFNPAINSLFPSDILKLGSYVATIKGQAMLSLFGGPFKGQAWTGIG